MIDQIRFCVKLIDILTSRDGVYIKCKPLQGFTDLIGRLPVWKEGYIFIILDDMVESGVFEISDLPCYLTKTHPSELERIILYDN